MFTRIFALTLFALLFTTAPTSADTYVHGYTRHDGTYVQPHYRSSPDSTVTNNYSYEGNANPYTGQVGTNHYEHDQTSPYYVGPDDNGNVGHSSGSSYGYPSER
jgi:hypothetical protein